MIKMNDEKRKELVRNLVSELILFLKLKLGLYNPHPNDFFSEDELKLFLEFSAINQILPIANSISDINKFKYLIVQAAFISALESLILRKTTEIREFGDKENLCIVNSNNSLIEACFRIIELEKNDLKDRLSYHY